MTLILKSNAIAKNYIKTNLSSKLPEDLLSSLDFVGEQYISQERKVALSSLLSVVQSGSLGYIDANEQYAVASTNKPRIHYDPNAGKGLLAEPSVANLLSNPNAPATQTVNITLAITEYLVMQIFGSGSVTTIINGSEYQVTQNNPLAHHGAFTGDVSLQVNGSIDHFQMYKTTSPRIVQSKLGGTQNQDRHYFQGFGALKEFTVVMRRKEINKLIDYKFNSARTVLQILGKTVNALSLNNIEGSGSKFKHIVYNNGGGLKPELATNVGANILDEEVVVLGFNLTTSTIKIAANGVIQSLTLSTFSETEGIDRILLGTPVAGGIAGATTSQVIKEVYLFDRVLSDEEITKIYA